MTKLREKLDKEMQEFKNEYLPMAPTEVYNDWYIIMFYESYYEMLVYYIEENLNEDIIEWLNTYDNPIGFLYCEWVSCDGSFCMLWDDMVAWLQDLKDDVEINSKEEF